jgi:NAD(P)-dependent dehydrogenase (short-subunit alcohol dehydrogenase family)
MSFQGKSAIVTGGAGYIGGAICRQLAEQGANVAVFDINRQRVEEVASSLPGAKAFAGDLADCAAVKAVVAEAAQIFGSVDFLVTCAGGSARSRIKPFAAQDMGVIREVIETNLFGALHAIHSVAPLMIERTCGKIVNISSIVALGGKAGCTEYGAAKAAIISATRSLAIELGPHNINVNCVSPGKVQRPDEMPSDQGAFARQHSYLNRICTAEDVAELVVFLLSDKADYITGQNYIIDGGRSLGLKGD